MLPRSGAISMTISTTAATSGLEVGTRRFLHPGPLLWLRATAWMVLLFVVFTLIYAGASYFAAPMFKDGDGSVLGVLKVAAVCVAGLIAYAGVVRLAEGRWPEELSLRQAPLELLAGLVIGALMLTAVVAGLYLLGGRDDVQHGHLVSLFDRSEDYAGLLAAIGAVNGGEAKALRAVRREFSALSAIDYFPGEARRQVEEALVAIESAASGEPGNGPGKIQRLTAADFQGRTWATRKHLWVDRMASAWLIRRFIDRAARFLWLEKPEDCPPEALGFDFDGAAFTHVGQRVTFEVLLASFGLESDPALMKLAGLVHYLDAGGLPLAEAAGLELVLGGLRASQPDDDALLAAAGGIFDGIYMNFNTGDTP